MDIHLSKDLINDDNFLNRFLWQHEQRRWRLHFNNTSLYLLTKLLHSFLELQKLINAHLIKEFRTSCPICFHHRLKHLFFLLLKLNLPLQLTELVIKLLQCGIWSAKSIKLWSDSWSDHSETAQLYRLYAWVTKRNWLASWRKNNNGNLGWTEGRKLMSFLAKTTPALRESHLPRIAVFHHLHLYLSPAHYYSRF